MIKTWLNLFVTNFYTHEDIEEPVTSGKIKIMNHPKLQHLQACC